MSNIKSRIAQDMKRQDYRIHTKMKWRAVKTGHENKQPLELRDSSGYYNCIQLIKAIYIFNAWDLS